MKYQFQHRWIRLPIARQNQVLKAAPKKKENEEGETDMTNNTIVTTNEVPEQRRYLYCELMSSRGAKSHELETKYGLRDKTPKNVEEAIKWIKDGKIVINAKAPDYYTWYDKIRFRDPDLKEDIEGFKEARSKMAKSSDDVERIIKIKTPDEGLAALIEFESKTFH